MIDIDNYKRAIRWLRRGLVELLNDPADSAVRLSVLQSFEVMYNISEALLRQASASFDDQEDVTFISTCEVIRRASEEGLVLSTARQWMHYGFVLESMRESCSNSVGESFRIFPELLLNFADEMESFAHNLELRGSALV